MGHAFSYDHDVPSSLDHHGHVDDSVCNGPSCVCDSGYDWVDTTESVHDSTHETLLHAHEKNVYHVPQLVQ